MKLIFKSKCALALVSGALLSISPALADKPDWAGGGNKGGKHDRSTQRHDNGSDQHHAKGKSAGKGSQNKHALAPKSHFEDRHSVLVRDYYDEEMRGGRCPPGLAKKQNGCMPPGQAKKWNVGQRLPAGVIYHTVPQPLVTQIGAPPQGYRYIRIGNDILMISSGTGVIIDAIANFGRS